MSQVRNAFASTLGSASCTPSPFIGTSFGRRGCAKGPIGSGGLSKVSARETVSGLGCPRPHGWRQLPLRRCVRRCGTWTLVTVVLDRTNNQILGYINGVPTGTPASLTETITTTDKLGIGARVSAPDNFVNAKIDDVRIYNRALSASEVARLYHLGTARVTTH
jgi:Concanavalin A-like lectin/glucanases superfamily